MRRRQFVRQGGSASLTAGLVSSGALCFALPLQCLHRLERRPVQRAARVLLALLALGTDQADLPAAGLLAR
jgi:hypothetical protein